MVPSYDIHYMCVYVYVSICIHIYIHMYEHDLLDVCTTQEERDVRACLAPHESKERRRASQSLTTRHRKTQSATECHRSHVMYDTYSATRLCSSWCDASLGLAPTPKLRRRQLGSFKQVSWYTFWYVAFLSCMCIYVRIYMHTRMRMHCAIRLTRV